VNKREFVTLLGGVSAMWPLAAHAQQSDRMRRVVFLHGLSEGDPELQTRVAAFREELAKLGWTESRDIQVEHRFAGGDLQRIQTYTAEVIASSPDLIVATGTPVVAALKQATRTIPIVFAVVNDPAGQGFVESLARPGGNITGFSYVDFPMIGKWMELMKEIVPSTKRITLMFNPQTAPYYSLFLREFGAAATPLAVELSATPVSTASEIDAAIREYARGRESALIAAPDPFINSHRGLIIALAQIYGIPTLFGFRQHVHDGGLISYGPGSVEIVRRSASYVDRILKGERPAELPVQSPTKYELAINLRTAKALGLEIPPTLLARADEVIE